jgi:hypothetical protein
VALIEVRALHALTAIGGPLRTSRGERMAAGAALGEDLGALVGGVIAGDLDALGSTTRGRRDRGYSDQ